MGGPTIRLHPKHGVNPRMTYCTRCGGEAEEIMLIGIQTGKYNCESCGLLHYGYPRGGKCGKCGGHVKKTGEIGEYEKLPASQPCKKCRDELDGFKKLVDEGGVYWRCDHCNSSGVIKASSPFAGEVRQRLNIQTGPCGVALTKKQCPICSKKGGE